MLSKSENAEGPIYIRIKEAATILNVTTRTMYDMIQSKIGVPVRKIGTRTLRIPRVKFLEWIEKQQGRAT